MSVDTSIFNGVYLNITGKIDIKREVEISGCPTCKTSMVAPFCSKCGTAYGKFTSKKTVLDVSDLVSYAHDQEVIDGEVDDIYDTFFLNSDEYVVPFSCEVVGKVYDSRANINTCHQAAVCSEDDAREFYKDIIKVLDHYNITYKLVNGVALFAY